MKKIVVYKNTEFATNLLKIKKLIEFVFPKAHSIFLEREAFINNIFNFDIVLFPGGSAKSHYKTLGEDGRKKLIEFVHCGGIYIGICAGAYLGSTIPKHYGLGLAPLEVIDRKNWKRGNGIVELVLNEKVFSMYYHNGPLLQALKNANTFKLKRLAFFKTDLYPPKGIPGVMPGKLAITYNSYGYGWICFIVFSTPRIQYTFHAVF